MTYTSPFNAFASSGFFISSVPTCEAFGQCAGPLFSLPSASSAGVVKPSSSGPHAAKPAACPGLIATPSGNVTVVSLMFAAPMPSPVVKPSCGTFTSAVKPAGVSAYDVSGATVNDGGNDKWSHPVNPTGVPVGSCERKLSLGEGRPFSQLSIVNVVFNGPSHDVGNVNNGRGALPTAL